MGVPLRAHAALIGVYPNFGAERVHPMRRSIDQMRKVLTIAASCAVVASLGAGSAFAGNGNGQGNGPKGNSNGSPNANSVANQQCNAEKRAMGNKEFKALYGKRAQKSCRASKTNQANGTIRNAAQECKAEMADPNFPAGHGGMTFAEFYGTNHNDRNAFGKCVSGKVHELVNEIRNNLLNAAQLCREERSDPNFANDHGGKSFEEFYGKNKNKRNAFGKCVSGKAKAAPAPTPTPVS